MHVFAKKIKNIKNMVSLKRIWLQKKY